MTQYLYDLTDTWNNVATTFDAIKINVTDTNSATASKLIDLQVGGVSKFKVQKDGDVTADRLTVTKTTANAPAISSTGYSLTGSDATSLVDLAGTWNTSGAPTAIKLNITESSTPNANANLIDLQRGGSSLFKVTRAGVLIYGSSSPEYNGITTNRTGSAILQIGSEGTGGFYFSNSTGATYFLYMRGGTGLAFNGSTPIGFSAASANANAMDLTIHRDAADALALRRTSNAQTFNIYNTYSSSTSYERLSIIAQSNAAVRIVTNKGSGGGAAQALELGTDGNTNLTIATSGNVTLSGSITVASTGTISHSARVIFSSPAAGVYTLQNNTQNDWNRLQFGGTTSSFPALKRSSATLICRLADDSANAAFESASLKTDAPAGGTAATWKLGAVATVSPTSPDRTIEVDIGGTIYYIHAKTTNN